MTIIERHICIEAQINIVGNLKVTVKDDLLGAWLSFHACSNRERSITYGGKADPTILLFSCRLNTPRNGSAKRGAPDQLGLLRSLGEYAIWTPARGLSHPSEELRLVCEKFAIRWRFYCTVYSLFLLLQSSTSRSRELVRCSKPNVPNMHCRH